MELAKLLSFSLLIILLSISTLLFPKFLSLFPSLFNFDMQTLKLLFFELAPAIYIYILSLFFPLFIY